MNSQQASCLGVLNSSVTKGAFEVNLTTSLRTIFSYPYSGHQVTRILELLTEGSFRTHIWAAFLMVNDEGLLDSYTLFKQGWEVSTIF